MAVDRQKNKKRPDKGLSLLSYLKDNPSGVEKKRQNDEESKR